MVDVSLSELGPVCALVFGDNVTMGHLSEAESGKGLTRIETPPSQ